jgi:PAS domain S-box-containing protein
MNTIETPLSRGLPCVVVMLTTDRALQSELPISLAALDGSVEVQIIGSLPSLERHLDDLRPDVLVVDTAALNDGDRALSQMLRAPVGQRAPVLAVAPAGKKPNPATRLALLGEGLTDYLARTDGYLDILSEAVLVTGRLARLTGQIAEQERHYRDIFEGLHEGVFVTFHGMFTYVNRAMAALFGQSPSELIGAARLTDCIAPEERQAVTQRLQGIEITGGEAHVFEVHPQHTAQGGTVYEVSCHASVVDGGRGVVGIVRDVTAARRAQAELEQSRQRAAQVERLRALGELSAGVAHDFNNALGTILGRVALAKDKLGRQEAVVDDLAVIEMAGRHAAHTVQRIQEYSRPSMADNWQDLILGEVVHEAVDFVRTNVQPGVQLVVQVEPTQPIRGNRTELREVLLNLLRNAFDAVGPRGAVFVTCKPDGGRALVEVRDTGHGMPDDVKQRIFQPFYSTKGDRGTGLGLSVSHWILRRHDAQIEVHSAPGQGTTFTLSFYPFKPSEQPTPNVGKRRMSILVVDDDATVAEMMRDLLLEQGHRVHIVGNAASALAQLQKQSFDLLITDLDLPDMGGWMLARRVREISPTILVGMVSGWPLGASLEELQARGVNFVLSKPFSIDTMNRALQKVASR